MEKGYIMVGRRKKASPLPPRLYEYKGKRHSTFYTITASNERVNLGHDLHQAKRKLLEMEEGRSVSGTVGEMLDDYLKEVEKRVRLGKRSHATLKDNLRESVQLKIAFGTMNPRHLRPNHVWQYLHRFRGAEAPVRANREISLLQTTFNWARDQGLIDTNPCEKVARNEEEARSRLVTDAELEAFCKYCQGTEAGSRVALAARMSYLTGKGQAQILRLNKTNIGTDGIAFGKRKGGAATLVEWTSILRGTVDECLALPSKVPSVYLICTVHGQPYTSAGFGALWQSLMNKWENAGNERFNFHDLRAKAVTDMIEDGRKASELTGHRTEAMPAKVYDRRAVRKTKAVR